MKDQRIRDESDLRKYRIELPNLYDDADLDPFEFRLLAHYKRVGNCYESTRTTAKKCKMSIGKVSEVRSQLAHSGWIETRDNERGTIQIAVIDHWAENFSKYSKRSLSEHDVHVVNTQCSLSEPKKEPIQEGTNKNLAREKTPRAPDPEITPPKVSNEQRAALEKTFTEITGLHPPANLKEAGKRWWAPLRVMLQEADGQSESVLKAAVKQMQKDGLTIEAPASVLKNFRHALGQRNLSGMKSAATPDPFAGLYEMMERKAHENNR